MSGLLVGLLVVLVVPLVLSSWRASLLGLSVQGLLLGLLALEQARPPSLAVGLLLVDTVLLRGLVAPALLYGVLRAKDAPHRNDVLPANLLSWSIAGALLFAAFRFGHLVSDGGTASTHLSVAAAAVLLGLLILATQNGPLSQVVGFLRIENGLLLLELASPELPPAPLHVGLLAIFLLTVLTFAAFLRRAELARPLAPSTALPDEEPTL